MIALWLILNIDKKLVNFKNMRSAGNGYDGRWRSRSFKMLQWQKTLKIVIKLCITSLIREMCLSLISMKFWSQSGFRPHLGIGKLVPPKGKEHFSFGER